MVVDHGARITASRPRSTSPASPPPSVSRASPLPSPSRVAAALSSRASPQTCSGGGVKTSIFSSSDSRICSAGARSVHPRSGPCSSRSGDRRGLPRQRDGDDHHQLFIFNFFSDGYDPLNVIYALGPHLRQTCPCMQWTKHSSETPLTFLRSRAPTACRGRPSVSCQIRGSLRSTIGMVSAIFPDALSAFRCRVGRGWTRCCPGAANPEVLAGEMSTEPGGAGRRSAPAVLGAGGQRATGWGDGRRDEHRTWRRSAPAGLGARGQRATGCGDGPRSAPGGAARKIPGHRRPSAARRLRGDRGSIPRDLGDDARIDSARPGDDPDLFIQN